MITRSGALAEYWPTTQALDLVEGPIDAVAAAVEAEVRKFTHPELITTEWKSIRSLAEAFASCQLFTNVPTFYLVLPTLSRWSVLWNNSFLCDGYDSLCYCLTQNHGMTTLHWSAHEESTTFQPGASFTWRSWNSGVLAERSVYCGREDKRWIFHTSGTPLPEEDTSTYGAKRKKDRLNEPIMLALLQRLGARPWDEAFYAVSTATSFVMSRPAFPNSIQKRSPKEVLIAV